MKKSIFFFSLLFLYTKTVCADIVITEIMYDVPGADAGREWIEVKNTGSAAVDLSLLRFLENGTNHKLTPGGESLVPSGGYAIIADNPTSFAADYPSFSGIIFDSSFSLSNTGEELSIKDGDVVLDTVLYVSLAEADGTGGTLQKVGSNWAPLSATPGASSDLGTVIVAEEDSVSEDEESSAGSQSSSLGGGDTVADPDVPELRVRLGEDKKGVAGAPLTFFGSATVGGKDVPDTARFLWNFGDGKTFIGKTTSHVYRSPGRYIATLTVSQGDFNATDMATITITPSPIVIAEVSPGPLGFVSLKNNGAAPIDISSWYLEDGGKWFVFPPGTFIAPGTTVRFDADTTGIAPLSVASLTLRFPSGMDASRVEEESVQKTEPQAETVNVPQPSVGVATKKVVVPETASLPPSVSNSPNEEDSRGEMATAALLGEVLATEDSAEGGSLWWYVAFAAVLFVGVAGAFFIEKKKPVDEFEIIEGDE